MDEKMSDVILATENNHVLTITLNRLDKKNALTHYMYEQLCSELIHATENANIHCVVIQGNDQCFCAGNDLQDFLKCTENDELAALAFVKLLATFNKPIVAAVAGVAVGIGTTLLLHCDMVIAADNSIFKLPFTQLGLCPEAGSSLLLTQKVGANKAFELMVLGESFNALQAQSFGIVNQVCSPNEVIEKTANIAQSIANLPFDAVMTSRRLIRQANQQPLTETINDESQAFFQLVNSPECKEILARVLSQLK